MIRFNDIQSESSDFIVFNETEGNLPNTSSSMGNYGDVIFNISKKIRPLVNVSYLDTL